MLMKIFFINIFGISTISMAIIIKVDNAVAFIANGTGYKSQDEHHL